MESDVTQSDIITKLWVFGDKYRKQLIGGGIALVVVGIVVAFWLTHKHEMQNDANFALSRLVNRSTPGAPEPTADALLKVASDYPGTDAGERALLLAAGDLFVQGKYDVAQAQFHKFVQDYNSSPLVAQAAIGEAACYEAQGKTNEAMSGYDSVINRYANQNVVPQAKLSMARLLEGQGKFKEARATLDELAHTVPGALGSEAAMRLQELDAAHPELKATSSPALVQPVLSGTTPAAAGTAPKTPAAGTSAAPAQAAPATTNLKTP